MSETYRFNVDVTNPGQFLACCGLLELASCLDAEAMAHFAEGDFVTSFDPQKVIKTLLSTKITAREMPPEEFRGRCASSPLPATSTTIDPIKIGKPFDLTIDWWLYPRGATQFKTWSGDKQIPVKILQALTTALKDIIRDLSTGDKNLMTTLVNYKVNLAAQPFYFDGVYSRHPIDVGYSIAKLANESLPHGAFTELMAFVGLQRFEPKSIGHGSYKYCVWHEPLPINIAAAIAVGLLPTIPHSVFAFDVTNRDDYHKQFSPAERKNNA